jgi:hypothetical protein
LSEGLKNNDWEIIHAATHKLIPSFSIMGIDKKFEDVAKKIMHYISTKKQLNRVPKLVQELITSCNLVIAESNQILQEMSENNSFKETSI